MGSSQSKQGQQKKEPSPNVKELPTDILLDSFAHLLPMEIDGSLRLVNRAYNTLVEEHSSILPKHTVSIRVESAGWIPFQILSRRPSSYIAVEWNSSEGDKSKKHCVAIDTHGLKTLLGSKRLARIPLVAIGDTALLWNNTSLADILYKAGAAMQQPLITKLKVSCCGLCGGSCHRIAQALRPICLEIGCHISSIGIREWTTALPSETTHVIHLPYFGIKYQVIVRILHGLPNQHVVFYFNHCFSGSTLISQFAAHFLLINPTFVNLVNFIDSLDPIQLGQLKFPQDVLLLFKHYPTAFVGAASRLALGQPDESQRRVDKLVDAEVDDDHDPGHDYYRRLEGCEWDVWRMSNPYLEAAIAANGQVPNGNAGRKYLQVMLKVGGSDEIGLAVFLKMVDES